MIKIRMTWFYYCFKILCIQGTLLLFIPGTTTNTPIHGQPLVTPHYWRNWVQSNDTNKLLYPMASAFFSLLRHNSPLVKIPHHLEQWKNSTPWSLLLLKKDFYVFIHISPSNNLNVKRIGFGARILWVWICSVPFINCVTLGKLSNLCGPYFLTWKNGDNSLVYRYSWIRWEQNICGIVCDNKYIFIYYLLYRILHVHPYGTLFKIGPPITWTSALNWLNVMLYKLQRSVLEAHAPALSLNCFSCEPWASSWEENLGYFSFGLSSSSSAVQSSLV